MRPEKAKEQKKKNAEEVREKTEGWTAVFRGSEELLPEINKAFNIKGENFKYLKNSMLSHETYEVKMQEKKVNQYCMFDEKKESFESNLASNRKADPGIKIFIKEDGDWKTFHTRMGRQGQGDWEQDYKGIKRKVVSSSNNGRLQTRGRSWWKERYKIEREALGNLEDIIVMEYRLNKGGEAGGRKSQDREWNHFEILSVFILKSGVIYHETN